jgi:hypothetical protein
VKKNVKGWNMKKKSLKKSKPEWIL